MTISTDLELMSRLQGDLSSQASGAEVHALALQVEALERKTKQLQTAILPLMHLQGAGGERITWEEARKLATDTLLGQDGGQR